MFILFLVVGVKAFPQTYMSMELWVGRIPVKDSIRRECLYQKVLLYTDSQRFGVVSETDTVALVAKKDLPGAALMCLDLVSNDNYVFEHYITGDGFIFFLTPHRPKIAKYSLVYSTTTCLQNVTKD